MGSDIRMFVEKRNYGKWESINGQFSDKTMDISYGDELYFERNYELFAILAGVRNGEGVDGPATGHVFNPISPPKGLPDDISNYVKFQYEKQSVDESSAHDCSWLLLKELLEFDWTQNAKVEAYVSPQVANNFYENGIVPNSIDCKHKSNRVIKLGYPKIQWASTYAARAGMFFDEVIPRLSLFGEREEVRIVFWFSS
jgi:hypothetical protein